MNIRIEKIASLLTHCAANYIAREAGRTTLITPTRAEVAGDLSRATIFVSVFPTGEETHALAYLTRQQDDFRTYLKKEARLRALPRISFALDEGERSRQRLDDISRAT